MSAGKTTGEDSHAVTASTAAGVAPVTATKILAAAAIRKIAEV